MFRRWLRALALGVGIATTVTNAQQPAFPSATWSTADPRSAGWSVRTLDSARTLWSTLPPASVYIVERGRLVAAWGDPARRIKVS